MIRSVGFRSYRVPQTRISRWLAPPADRDNFVRQAGRRLTGWGSFSDMLGLAHAGRIHRTKGELFRALSGLERANRGLDRALGSLRRLRANRLRPGRARGGRRCRALGQWLPTNGGEHITLRGCVLRTHSRLRRAASRGERSADSELGRARGRGSRHRALGRHRRAPGLDARAIGIGRRRALCRDYLRARGGHDRALGISSRTQG